MSSEYPESIHDSRGIQRRGLCRGKQPGKWITCRGLAQKDGEIEFLIIDDAQQWIAISTSVRAL